MSGHGFRAMARTLLGEVLDFRSDSIERQRAHAVRVRTNEPTIERRIYKERHRVMQVWASYLDQLKAGGRRDPDSSIDEIVFPRVNTSSS